VRIVREHILLIFPLLYGNISKIKFFVKKKSRFFEKSEKKFVSLKTAIFRKILQNSRLTPNFRKNPITWCESTFLGVCSQPFRGLDGRGLCW